MRQRFSQQQVLGITPIAEVVIPKNSRHELAPVLAALQYIFVTPELNEQVFALIEPKIKGNKQDAGRTGMDLWEILVFATVRLTLNADYDALHHFSNFDKLIRQVTGVENRFNDGKTYGLQTLKDNVSLLDEETVNQVNTMVVEAAHQFVLKKKEPLRIKSDTYVLETNVHFPTDLNLLWDACRKGIDTMEYCREHYGLKGWRKSKSWRSSLKSSLRSTGKACVSTSKHKANAIIAQVEEYLRLARELDQKIAESCLELNQSATMDIKLFALLQALSYYQEMIKKHIDLIERRLLKGETIPSAEKLFSIFESHTEWISKGKQNKKVELGHKVLIATDQHHFILHHQVIEGKADAALTIPLADSLLSKYKNIESLSLDKGFYSKENKDLLSLLIPQLVMPKKGKLNAGEKQEESAKKFKKLRNLHSGVESNINQLEHNGLDRCPDKGIKNYKRYVSLGILSYNLHRLGKILLADLAKQALRQAA
jgi:transposase, IS5 family